MDSPGSNRPQQHDQTLEPEVDKVSHLERVFPIRVQAIHESPKAKSNSESQQGKHMPIHESIIPKSQTFRENEPVASSAAEAPTAYGSGPLVTVPLVDHAQGHEFVRTAGTHVITERFSLAPQGEASTADPDKGQKIHRCEDEPIHIPGAIQQFGALIALKEYGDRLFSVRIASENSQLVIGHTPETLFQLRSFTDLLPSHDRDEFMARVRSLWERPEECQRTKLDIFSISLTSLVGAPNPVWCALHLVRDVDLVVCEFELQNDASNPIQPPDDGLPEEPVHIADCHISEEAQLLSTTIRSKPLHALRFARERSIELGPMVMFDALREIQSQLSAATDLSYLLELLVGLIAELTSFHRATVYHFEDSKSGFVMSEFVNERASTDFYRGLHFPASDIPKQARELYMVNTIRILYDRDQETARLVCRSLDDAIKPLDLTHSYLRAMSPVHLKYLGNMGVRASMSISLPVNGKLWGLVSLHGYGTRRRVAPPLRELCRSIGDCAGAHIERLLYSSKLQNQKAISSIALGNSPSRYVAASLDEILKILGADFGLLVIKGEARSIGKLRAYDEAIALLQCVRAQAFTSIFASQDVVGDFRDLPYSPGFSTIAGLLVIPLALAGADFILLFRVGQLQEVGWAGNPYEKTLGANSEYLEPRASFRRWNEHIMGKSREWTADEVDSAAILRDIYGRFIEIWRQKEIAIEREQMMRLLIRNASHEAHPSLNSILEYLEMALGETADKEARKQLEKSLMASTSLVFILGDLLTLTNVKGSDLTRYDEAFSLRAMLSQGARVFEKNAMHGKLHIRFDNNIKSVPQLVRGNESHLMQVISHLLSTLSQNVMESTIILGLRHVKTLASGMLIEIFIEDTSSGLSEQELDTFFHYLEKAQDEEVEEEDTSRSQDAIMIDATPQKSIERELAAVARYVRTNHSEIRIATEEGKWIRISLIVLFQEVIRDNAEGVGSSTIFQSPNPLTDSNNPKIRKRKYGELGA